MQSQPISCRLMQAFFTASRLLFWINLNTAALSSLTHFSETITFPYHQRGKQQIPTQDRTSIKGILQINSCVTFQGEGIQVMVSNKQN